MGVVGGHNYTPEFLKEMLDDLKAGLTDKSLPFGVDLLLPKVGEATLTLTLTPNLALPLTLNLALTRSPTLTPSPPSNPRWARVRARP